MRKRKKLNSIRISVQVFVQLGAAQHLETATPQYKVNVRHYWHDHIYWKLSPTLTCVNNSHSARTPLFEVGPHSSIIYRAYTQCIRTADISVRSTIVNHPSITSSPNKDGTSTVSPLIKSNV